MDHSVLNGDCQCLNLTKLLIDDERCACGSSIAFQKLFIDYLEMDYKRRLFLSCSPEAQGLLNALKLLTMVKL